MSSRSSRLTTPIGTALIACAFAQGPVAAQTQGPPPLQTGTTLSFEGWESQSAPCILDHYYEQFMKFAGRVILPDTNAKVYDFIEYSGRDSGTQVIRFSPRGTFVYSIGIEQEFFTRGPVGTYWEVTDPESRQVLRFQIVKDGITVTLPTGAVYENVTRMNVYCTTCGPEWVLQESHWLGSDLPGFPVLFMDWDAGNECVNRWLWLVSVTPKQEGRPN